MQALLVGLVCHECGGFASRSCCRKPRAALAEAGLPWAESAAPSGLKKNEKGVAQRYETASYLSAIHVWPFFAKCGHAQKSMLRPTIVMPLIFQHP